LLSVLADLCFAVGFNFAGLRELKEVALATLHTIRNVAKADHILNFYRQSSAKADGKSKTRADDSCSIVQLSAVIDCRCLSGLTHL